MAVRKLNLSLILYHIDYADIEKNDLDHFHNHRYICEIGVSI